MGDILDLLDLRQEIMARVENVLEKAINYQRKFDCFAHLWQDDRAEFLSQFLLFGRALRGEEMEASKAGLLSKSASTIDNFKNQVKVFFFMNHILLLMTVLLIFSVVVLL